MLAVNPTMIRIMVGFTANILLEFAHNDTMMNSLRMEETRGGARFLQVLDGRFRLFTLILSVSPQISCCFRAIYHLDPMDHVPSLAVHAVYSLIFLFSGLPSSNHCRAHQNAGRRRARRSVVSGAKR